MDKDLPENVKKPTEKGATDEDQGQEAVEEILGSGPGCFTIFAGIFGTIFFALWLLMYFTGDSTEAIIYIKQHLKSPDSFSQDHANSGSVYEADGYMVYKVSYEAANSFGGAIRGCNIVLIKEGSAVDMSDCKGGVTKGSVQYLLKRNGKEVSLDSL